MSDNVVPFPRSPLGDVSGFDPGLGLPPTPEDMARMYAWRALVIAAHENGAHDARADHAAIEKLFVDAMAGRPLDWDVVYPDGGVMRGA